jgi:hypothetical protein
VLVLVLVLLVTNLATLAVLVLRTWRPAHVPADVAEVFEAPRPPGVTSRERQLITIEVLDPLELASSRGGRIAGLAGSLAPNLTRRIVYQQVVKTLRSELDRMAVHADVRLHTLRAVPRSSTPVTTPDPTVVDATVVDEVAPLDLDP